MRSNLKKAIHKCCLMLFVSVYVFIAISHIFYLPNISSERATLRYFFNHQMPVKSQHGLPYTKIGYKSTTINNKRAIVPALQMATIALLMITVFGAITALKPLFTPQIYSLANKRYTYLSFCTIRV